MQNDPAETLSPQRHKFSPHRIENLFFLNGISSLLGWNVVLASLDYFFNAYSNYNVFLYFPIPCFVAYAITGITFHWLSKRFNYKVIVPVGIVGTNLCIVLTLIVSLTTSSQPLGFWISLVLIFFMGAFANISQLSFFGMINYFGDQTVSRYTIGTAAGGLFITLLRCLIVSILGTREDNVAPIIIYISIALAFNFYDCYLNIKLFKSAIYNEMFPDTLSRTEQSLIEDSKVEETREEESFFEELKGTMQSIHPYPLFILLNYVVTFMLFPNLTFSKKTDLKDPWGILLFLTMYNIGDFLGKIIGDFRKSFNGLSMKFLFLSRLFFFYTICLMAA